MKNLSRHCGTIENLTRLPSSRNGISVVLQLAE